MSAAQRYHPRSPRYLLQTSDDKSLRFAAMDARGQSSSSEILDLSESGMAFEVPPEHVLSEGEVLKIEFTVPDRTRIACFATVVRVEPSPRTDFDSMHASPHTRVGLQFRYLPSAYRRLLEGALRHRIPQDLLTEWENLRHKQLASFTGVALAALAILFVMAIPYQSWLSSVRSLF